MPAGRSGSQDQGSGAEGSTRAETGEIPSSTRTLRSIHSAAGTVIGPYRLLQQIGEGGMGEVWLAEQKQPVRRRVAIKLIKIGMDTREVVARFESERQALALMDHPAIAKVFDAGSTPEGRPYFAMQYVAGLPITDYCGQHKLSPRQRLELFILVCEGVQHAHQKAIIHRDLKPSNILVSEVDGKPMPRIIDFGVAKATSQRLSAGTLHTRVGSIIGTVGYMSPEQANSEGQDIDTRTDVYSLGVVLYELLVGALPFDFTKLTYEEILRRLREEDAPRPSTKLRTLAGDADAIALKALEKDRSRRYSTPSELAADIARYLRNEPVTARPAGAWYRTRKYVRRHRVAVGVAVTAAVLLVAFAAAQTIELRRVRLERDRADRVTAFMTGMFKVSDPSEARGNDVRAREILDKASQDIDTGLAKEPELQAQMMDVMGNVYKSLGLFSKSESLLRRAIAIRTQALGAEHPDTLKSMYDLSDVLMEDSKYPEAEKLDRETVDVRRRVLGAQNHDTLASMSKLALIMQNEGRYADAEKLNRSVLDTTKRAFGPQDQLYLDTLQHSAIVSAYQGKYSDAEKAFREILEIDRRKRGPEDPRVLDDTGNLASTLLYEEHYGEAEKLYRGVLPQLRRIRGPDHPRTLLVEGNLALTLKDENRYPEAEQLFRETLEIKRKKLGPEHRSTLVTMGNLADTLTEEGKYSEAEQLVRQAMQTEQRTLGPDHTDTLATTMGLAEVLKHEKRYPESEAFFERTLEGLRRAVGANHPDTAKTAYQLADVLALEGKRDAALSNLRFALDHALAPETRQGIDKDPDLKSLHGDPAFEALAAQPPK